MFLPHPRVKVSIVGSLRDREVACSASDRQGSNFESCVWRTVSSHHPQEVLLAQLSLYVHKGGLKPDSFHFISGCFLLKQVNVIGLHNFNNECTEADAFSSFLTITTAVIFLSILYNLSIMSSAVVFIFALLYVYITNNEYSNPSVTL